MDFHSLARRDLQALCKLNAIPANMTNVAMADALASLEKVEGMEDFLNRSPERKAATAAKAPRTGRKTCTAIKPIRDESESVQPMTKSTRRTTRRAVSDEIAGESKTPAVRSRKTTDPVTEGEGNENIDKRDVANTPAVATYSRRNQASRTNNVKEVSTVQRVYSTRRSVRLTEKEEKIDALATELSKIDLCEVADDKNLSGNVGETVVQESVEKSDVVASEMLNAVQEDITDSLMIENEKEAGAQEEIVGETVVQESVEKSDGVVLEILNAVQEDITDSLMIESKKEGGAQEEIVGETVVQESVVKSDEVALEILNAAQEEITDSLMIENEKEDGAQEEMVEELGQKSKPLDESQFLADSFVINNEDNKGYLMDTENPHEDESTVESGLELEDNEVQMKMVDEVKEDTKQLCNGLGKTHFVEKVDTNNLVVENKDIVKSLIDSNNPHEQLKLEYDPNGVEMNYGKSIPDEVEPLIGEADQHMTSSEESKAETFNNNFPKEIAPLVSFDVVEKKPAVMKMPSIEGLKCVSDDKENIDHTGMQFEPTKEEANKNKKASDDLHDKSLRELHKMLKEKLNISTDTTEDTGKVTKARPALQKLEVNCQQ